MNLIERARKIITNPKEEWAVINQETTTVTQLLTGYFLILALIPAIAQFVRYGLIGYNAPLIGHISGSVELGVKYAVIGYITYVLGAFLSAFIIDVLATSFGSQKKLYQGLAIGCVFLHSNDDCKYFWNDSGTFYSRYCRALWVIPVVCRVNTHDASSGGQSCWVFCGKSAGYYCFVFYYRTYFYRNSLRRNHNLSHIIS